MGIEKKEKRFDYKNKKIKPLSISSKCNNNNNICITLTNRETHQHARQTDWPATACRFLSHPHTVRESVSGTRAGPYYGLSLQVGYGVPPLGECKSRIQYYKPEPCEAEIEACLSRPPLLPAPQFWVTLSVSGATWASFLPCKRPLSFSLRYHTQTSSLFFSLREIKTAFSPHSSFCSSIQIYTALIGRDDTHTHSTRARQ